MAESEDSFDEVDQLISEDEYEVEAIVNHRKMGSLIEYLVKWKDYPDDSNTWEPAENLADAQKLVTQYNESIKKPKKSKKRKRTTKPERAASVDSNSSLSDGNVFHDSIAEDISKGDTDKLSGTTSNIKKIKMILPANGSSPANMTSVDDVDNAEFMDATGSDFGSDVDPDVKKSNGTLKSEFDDKLDRIEYKLEDDDGNFENIMVITDESYPSDDIDWEEMVDCVTIMIGKNSHNRDSDSAILKWKNGQYSLHRINEIRKSCPQRLIDYYQKFVLF